MKLIVFTRYEELGASSRVRFYNMKSYLMQGFDEVVFSPLIKNDQLRRIYQGKGYSLFALLFAYLKRFFFVLFLSRKSVLLIEKELFPNIPAGIELFLLKNRRYVLDYDDSIFHNYDMHRSPVIRKYFGRKIDELMKHSNLVFCGSHYLLERAESSGSVNNHLIPTVVRASRYDSKKKAMNKVPVIVWIGTPHTIKYLSLISKVLVKLASEHDFIMRVIGVKNFVIPGVNVESFGWSEETEVQLISDSDIGIMPLEDTPWERGKCGYKLIQYMACSLPVVGSAIGENNFIIDSSCGYCAANEDEWYRALKTLLTDPALRIAMGNKGRERFLLNYAEEAIGPGITVLLNKIKS